MKKEMIESISILYMDTIFIISAPISFSKQVKQPTLTSLGRRGLLQRRL